MFAVIRAGGKQYRVSPGDIIRIEKSAARDGKIEFNDVLAVSGDGGGLGKVADARVTGDVLEHARAAKILVFHFKRKKQYKKLYGHRQPYTSVRIVEIASGGQKYTAPELPKKPVHTRAAEETSEPAAASAHEAATPHKAKSAKPKAAARPAEKKAALPKKAVARKSSSKAGKKPNKK